MKAFLLACAMMCAFLSLIYLTIRFGEIVPMVVLLCALFWMFLILAQSTLPERR